MYLLHLTTVKLTLNTLWNSELNFLTPIFTTFLCDVVSIFLTGGATSIKQNKTLKCSGDLSKCQNYKVVGVFIEQESSYICEKAAKQ